ncbi:hypothetical protein LPJ61_000639 [Coemansia biformis]|uniref:ABC transporter ATPase n=1 Tax=Coemansia biformis TaxID=1286918 RepID=A0A9W7YHI7_9FUNG|nr:hypothetical protein LPJ61_000639 [Coemansia biformis]
MDGKQYGQYKLLAGRRFDFGGFTLAFDKVQSDAFAPPSRIRVLVDQDMAQFPHTCISSKVRSVASGHFLSQQVHRALFRLQTDRAAHGRAGGWQSAKGGALAIDFPGQEVLERTSVLLSAAGVEARLTAGLPAAGRTILGDRAQRMLLDVLPQVVEQAMRFASIDGQAMRSVIQSAEDQEYLRAQLAPSNLVAFIGDGAVLPRSSGVSNLPLAAEAAVLFKSPASMRVSFELPNRGRVTGMGIPRGVTLVCGGGFNGKSTLLQAIERGVYNHVPGDGRELVVADATATKIKAEEGRSVCNTDIRAFIDNLPFGKDTRSFSTPDASGSTSMAASIQEAIEVNASALLFDEDTCATNFLIRDRRMQQLVPQDREPITPLVSRVRELWDEKGVSSILVIGGCGDYLDVADAVVAMHRYEPSDITARAKAIAREMPAAIVKPAAAYGPVPARTVVVPRELAGDKLPKAQTRWALSLFPSRSLGSLPAPAPGPQAAGPHESADEPEHHPELDLSALDQLVSISQTRSIARIIHAAAQDPRCMTMSELLEEAGARPLDELCANGGVAGDLARPRGIEVALAINRLRCLDIRTEAATAA